MAVSRAPTGVSPQISNRRRISPTETWGRELWWWVDGETGAVHNAAGSPGKQIRRVQVRSIRLELWTVCQPIYPTGPGEVAERDSVGAEQLHDAQARPGIRIIETGMG